MREYALGFGSGALATLMVAGMAWSNLKPPIKTIALPAPPAKEITKYQTIIKPCPGIKVYPEKAKEKLGLPEAIAANPQADVVAATKLPPDTHHHTITAIYNAETLAVTLHDRRDPLPWLAFNRRHELGLAYGYSNAGTTAKVYGRMELLQLKTAKIGLVGDVDNNGGWFGGVNIGFAW